MPSHDDLSPLVHTACAPYHGMGVPSEDLAQEGWVAALEARNAYDPSRHHCPEPAFIVMCVRKRLSRLCAASRRRSYRESRVPLPAAVPSREPDPSLALILAERVAAERRKLDARREGRATRPIVARDDSGERLVAKHLRRP